MASPTTWASTSLVQATSDSFPDGLLYGTKWGGGAGLGTTLTYSFPQTGSQWSTSSWSGYGPITGEREPWSASFRGLSATEQGTVKAALRAWSSVAKISFTQVADTATSVGDMRFAFTNIDTALAYLPGSAATAGDVWFGASLDLARRGSYGFQTVLHEIGHAIGLKHPHEYEEGFPTPPSSRDFMEYTVMSYRSYVGAGEGYGNETGGYAQTPMMYDIAAVQHLYGANFTTNSGNTVYSWSPTTGEGFVNGTGQGAPMANRILQTVWDGGGADTYDFSNYAASLKIDLRPGAWSTTSWVQRANLGDGHYAVGNVANAFQYKGDARSLIENAKGGSGSDGLTGNTASNILWGNAGADKLSGLDGNDTLIGGSGADVLDGGGGTDRASYSTASVAVVADLATPANNTGDTARDRYISIEGLVGSSYGDALHGNDAANTLWGGGGNDRLGGQAGNDQLIGGTGADTLIGGSGADIFDFNLVSESTRTARDTIADFLSGTDKIDLRSIDANRLVSSNQAFAFKGAAAFTGAAGQLIFASGILSGDTNGDRVADFQVAIKGSSSLSASDFYL